MWVDEPGTGLSFSVVVYPEQPIARWPELTLVAARAVAGAIGERATIRDPNDVVVDGRKVAETERAALSLEPGEHSATCRIGDYTLTRKFTVARSKPYKLVLDIDLRVEEGQ